MNLQGLLHDFVKLQPPKLYKNVQELFRQAGKLFCAEIRKMAEFHFWANVMLRQPQVRASRTSPAQRLRGLMVILVQKLFKAYLFCFL